MSDLQADNARMRLRMRDPLRIEVPTVPRQRGAVRVYGRQREIGTAVGLLAGVRVSVSLVHLFSQSLPAEHGPVWLIVAFSGLLVAIPVGVILMSGRLGLRVTDTGIDNVGMDIKNFTPWEEVREFAVRPAPWIKRNLTVYLVRRDGQAVPLSRLGEYPRWRRRTHTLCEALNRELELQRGSGSGE